jgi:hypothetical protein
VARERSANSSEKIRKKQNKPWSGNPSLCLLVGKDYLECFGKFGVWNNE